MRMGSMDSLGMKVIDRSPAGRLIAHVFTAVVLLLPSSVSGQRALTRHVIVDGASHELALVGNVILLGGGVVAVSQPTEQEVLLFSAGRRIASIRRGEGPTEVPGVSGLGVRDSTTFWVSSNPRRLTIFDVSGNVVEQQPWPHIDGGDLPPIGLMNIVGMYRGRLPIVLGTLRSGGGTGTGPEQVMVVADAKGARSWIRRLSGQPRCLISVGTREVSSPFCAKAIRSVSPGGQWALLVDPVLTEPKQDRVKVVLQEVLGGERYAITLSFPPHRVNGAMIDSAIARYAALPGTRPDFLNAMRNGRHPVWAPVVIDALVTDDGNAWLNIQSTASARDQWMRLDHSGRTAQVVTLPTAFRPRFATSAGFIGVEEASDGTESIVRYDVEQRRQ
jgi:hypothetical protein